MLNFGVENDTPKRTIVFICYVFEIWGDLQSQVEKLEFA